MTTTPATSPDQADQTALATERPRLRMCVECREGRHHECEETVTDPWDGIEKACPCRRCYAPAPLRCPSCKGLINPQTAECRCSD